MKDRNSLWLLVAGVSLVGVFIIVSIVTMNSDTTQRVFVVLSEITGLATLGISVFGMVKKKEERWLYSAPAIFFGSWIMIAIAYEIGLDASTHYGWVWFVLYYIIAVAGIILLRKIAKKTYVNWSLFPVSLLFLQSIQLVYIVVIHIIWMVMG